MKKLLVLAFVASGANIYECHISFSLCFLGDIIHLREDSLLVQWLGLCALTANGQVQFLLGELKPHKPSSVARYYLGGRKKIASGLDKGRTGEKFGEETKS